MSTINGKQESPTILVVDDHPATLPQFGERLERFASRVITVATSARALEVRRLDSGPLLCLVDLKMPDGTGAEDVGLQLIEKLSRQPRTLVIAFCSCDEVDPSHDRARYAGAVAFIRKDIDPEDLDAKVGACLAQLKRDLPRRPVGMGVPQPIDPRSARKLREEREWLGHPENIEAYAGEVVALFNGVVWCHGPDHLSTFQAVRTKINRHAGEPGLPGLHDLLYLVIPDWKNFSESPWAEE